MYYVSKNLVIVKSQECWYAYNSVFGGLKKLTNDEIEIIQCLPGNGTECSMMHNELFNELVKCRFIENEADTDSNKLERRLEEYRKKVETGESISKLLLMVTGKCMLNCKYCYVPDSPEYNSTSCNDDMDWDTAKKAIDVFKSIVSRNGQIKVHIRFHGGEPFLNFELIKRAVIYAEEVFNDKEIVFHTNSNGVVIDDSIARFITTHKIHTEISMDGLKEIHDSVRNFPNGAGSFNHAINALNLIKKYNPKLRRVNIAVTLSKANYRHLRPLVDFCKSFGIAEVEVNTLLFQHPLDILEDVKERVRCLVDLRAYGVKNDIKVSGKWFKLFERLTDPVINYCGRMGQQIGVNSSGKVFLCTGYMHLFGEVEQWDEIIQSKEYLDICMRTLGRIDECSGCPVQGQCAGGCTASVIKACGSLAMAEKKECQFRKEIVEELIRNKDIVTSKRVAVEEVDSSYYPKLL